MGSCSLPVNSGSRADNSGGSCSEIGVEDGVDPGWHAHVFVGMFRWAKGLRTCPRRRGHATRDDSPPIPEHEGRVRGQGEMWSSRRRNLRLVSKYRHHAASWHPDRWKQRLVRA